VNAFQRGTVLLVVCLEGLHGLSRAMDGGEGMGFLVAFLILTLLLFGAGFALHLLWWIAVIALVMWLVGMIVHGPEGRWYRW